MPTEVLGYALHNSDAKVGGDITHSRGPCFIVCGEVHTTLIVGDDQTTDIAGAHAFGALAAMVGTGKGKRVDPNLPAPDYTLVSVAHLPELVTDQSVLRAASRLRPLRARSRHSVKRGADRGPQRWLF
jgi:ribonucleotide monophosphatase NagD (HAD superfamily)